MSFTVTCNYIVNVLKNTYPFNYFYNVPNDEPVPKMARYTYNMDSKIETIYPIYESIQEECRDGIKDTELLPYSVVFKCPKLTKRKNELIKLFAEPVAIYLCYVEYYNYVTNKFKVISRMKESNLYKL
jgi:hypothetical protein